MALQAPVHPSGSRPAAFVQRHVKNPSLSYTASAMAKSRIHSLSSKHRFRSLIPKVAESDSVATALPVTGDRMLVMVPPHPLIKHLTSVLRNEQTPPAMFKSAMAELGRLLIYEACRDWLPMISGEIQSPMGVANVEFVDPREPVAIIPILRAGLALAEHAATFLPATKTYHLGMSRDEETLQPSTYLNKIPETFPEGSRALVIDPMLATGGTIVAALDLLTAKGLTPKQIKVISAVAAPPALEKLSRKFPGLLVYTAMIDPVVNDKGFIVPGLGDAGDRCYGT
ncbi:Uracil phosphoribosyltransferase [Rhynchospora pubera]|uniref:uracil phosphoribosyltransferase n=1 Tax=Rhynchospora pubera TaxID=906938 RepID=A0AAV8CBE4_9POAL|nr:Uracil phosphoribosyltransferase [Rhynchospora pubera]KAJ4795836.1 Uracil phosphoribosyltransferase [Rhynchospora pubera]